MRVPERPIETLALRGSEDVVVVRRLARERLAALGFSVVDQTKMITAASELARNAVVHAGGGRVTFEELSRDGRQGLKLTFVDDGPGIADVDRALQDGYTTGGGLGLGLGGSRRLVNEFEIRSSPGKGTTVSIVRWR
jgi:serine/threonine-protein kinase RsbT